MADEVCIDSNLALIRVLPDDRRPQAESLFRLWRSQDVRLVAPPLFSAEVTSVIRQKVYDRFLTAEDGERAFAQSLNWVVAIAAPQNLQRTAWFMAKLIDQRRAYDPQYLALARLLGCEFWTGDERLYNAAHRTLPWVHWVGEAPREPQLTR